MTTIKFARPTPVRLVDVIPAPDETLARKIVELLARANTATQDTTTGAVDV